jgi:hypothetical protein
VRDRERATPVGDGLLNDKPIERPCGPSPHGGSARGAASPAGGEQSGAVPHVRVRMQL